jgi:uncharacterized damage-inducible protein DinB
MITNPKPDEYAPFYANYITLTVKQGDILQTLTTLKQSSWQTFNSITAEKQDYAYAEGKWTIKQLLSHMIDAERIFAYRVLRLLRGDQTPLPGFDENAYVSNTNLTNQAFTNLAAEFKTVREANLYLFNAITDEQSLLTGTASNSNISVRALLYIIVIPVKLS